jgi:penicillin-insensitive murein endopeptidase
MVGDGHAHVTHLFVATPIRERLLAYATKIGASPAIRSRASEVLAQPHGSLPHDDHFHVRVACPSGMDQCVEQPIARHHGHQVGALASHGHPAHPSAHEPSAPASHAAPAAAHGAHPAAPPRPASKPEREESAESSVPSLSPSVPGLDSAVIPAPLTGVRSTWGTSKDTKSDPISDPDGVLEHN